MNKKNITIDDELKLLEKYILNSSHAKTIKNNTTSSFLSEGRIYPFANDILNSSVNIDLTGKKSLVVTSSGDHALHAILAGSTDITSFDINRFCKYYSALKIALIKECKEAGRKYKVSRSLKEGFRYVFEEFEDAFPECYFVCHSDEDANNENGYFDTLEDETVTIRDRDTMEQVRVKIDDVEKWIEEKLEF